MKILVRIVLFLAIIIMLSYTTSYGTTFSWSDIKGDADNFINRGGNTINLGEANGLVQSLANILTTIGVVVVLGGLMIIGIKYMVATPEEAAKLKTKLVGLAVAGVVIIGAYGIWTLAYNILNGLTK